MRTPRLVVATDLDATLLDEQTYAWDAARPALQELRRRSAVLVLASSKTRAEMEPLARALGFEAPLIVENGGALLIPAGLVNEPPAGAAREADTWRVELGRRRDDLVAALAGIAAETGASLSGFGSMTAAEVAGLTGLGPTQAAAALQREYDEPFLLYDPARLPDVTAAAERRGLRVVQGGRFFHLMGPTDKGRALGALLALLRREGDAVTIALGDSPNDLELLSVSQHPVIVPRTSGPDPSLVAALPAAIVAPEPGPRGWNRALLALLERLPTG